MRAAIYLRVSDDKNGKSESVDEQDALLRADVAEHGWTVGGTYADPDISASRYASKARPDWARLRADIESGRIGVVALYMTARGSRELEDFAGFLNLCRRTGTRVWVHADAILYDPSNNKHWKILASNAVSNAGYSDDISDQVTRHLRTVAARGGRHGAPPFGYHLVFHDRVPAWEPSEYAADVRKIFEAIGSGVALREICRELSARDVPTSHGGNWHPRTIRHMVFSPTYLGQRTHKGNAVEAEWPALVDETTARRARAVLGDPARKNTRPSRSRYLLSYIAKCPCGQPLQVRDKFLTYAWAETSGRWSEPAMPARLLSPHYMCTTGRSGHAPAVPVRWADTCCELALIALLGSDDGWAFMTSPDDAATEALDAEIASLKADLAGMTELTGLAAARIAEATEQRLGSLQAERQALTRPAAFAALSASLPQRGTAISATWRGLDLARQRDCLVSSCSPVLNPGVLDDPARWDWGWKVSLSNGLVRWFMAQQSRPLNLLGFHPSSRSALSSGVARDTEA